MNEAVSSIHSSDLRRGFELLLEAVKKPNRDAVEDYQRIRTKLCRFFGAYSVVDPDELADESIDRVARKLGSGTVLDLSSDSYFLTVARFVLLEHRRGRLNRAVSLDDEESHFEPSYDPTEEVELISERLKKEIGLDAIAECRRKLSSKEQEILGTYNGGAGREKIERRNALALKLAMSKEALVVAVSRINSKLKNCVRQKLANQPLFAGA